MSSLTDVESKLNLADYLLNRDPPFPAAAMKHILLAANMLVTMHLNMDENAQISPQIACSKLADNPESKEFASHYMSLLNVSIKPAVLREDAENAYKATKSFFNLVKRARGSA
jgi:hypothetical protein